MAGGPGNPDHLVSLGIVLDGEIRSRMADIEVLSGAADAVHSWGGRGMRMRKKTSGTYKAGESMGMSRHEGKAGGMRAGKMTKKKMRAPASKPMRGGIE